MVDSGDKIEEAFSNLYQNELTGKEFDEYVMRWLDGEHISDMMEDWDIQTKKEAIKEMKSIIKKRNKKLIASKVFVNNKDKSIEVLYTDGSMGYFGFERFDGG